MEDAAKHQYALLADPLTGREFNLSRYATSLGRSLSCDIVLTDKSVSRQHAVIYCLKGKFYLEDCGSTNGTMLNKEVVSERIRLNSGDELRIGRSMMLFLLIPDRNSRGVYLDSSPTEIKLLTPSPN